MAASMERKMKPVQWRKNLSIGVQSIDDEHQLLIGVLNQLIGARGAPNQYSLADRMLRDLFAYADYHFEHEEDLMEVYEYPEATAHRALHVGFVERLRQLDKSLTTGTATVDDLARFVMNWFVAHILVIDMQLGQFLSERLCRERSPFEFEVHRLPTG